MHELESEQGIMSCGEGTRPERADGEDNAEGFDEKDWSSMALRQCLE